MKNKKGSHVGIVLSFVIFITFLIFIYTILQPEIRIQKDKEAFLDYLKIELMEEISTDLTSISVNSGAAGSCLEFKNLAKDTEINSHLIVKDELGNIVQSEISDDNLCIEGNGFFKIYHSEKFEESTDSVSGCNLVKVEDYTIGLVRTEEYVFDTKVIDLIEDYENNPNNLRSKLKVPIGSEFGFGLTYSDETKIGTEEKEISTNIYAEEIPVQYIDSEANINLGFINIQVW